MSQRIPGGIDPRRLRPGQQIRRAPGQRVPVALDPMAGSRVPSVVPGLDRAVPPDVQIVRAAQPPTQFYHVTGLGAIAPGTQGTDQTIEWRFDGRVIGLIAHARGDGSAAGQASLALRIQAGAEQAELCVNGNNGTGDWITFASICGINPLGVAPFYRDVCRNDRWLVSVFNFNGAGNTYTPEVTFHCVAE